MGLSACASARLNRSIGGSPVVPRWRRSATSASKPQDAPQGLPSSGRRGPRSHSVLHSQRHSRSCPWFGLDIARRHGAGSQCLANALSLSLKTTVRVAAFRTLVWGGPEIEYFRHPQVRALHARQVKGLRNPFAIRSLLPTSYSPMRLR
jgi:hypothetical protein